MIYYPKSLTRLILVGLVLILLPLTFAFYNVASNLELLAGRGQRAVFEAVQITQDSRLLIQRITDLERIVRQYMVVEDSKLLEGYFKLHEQVQNAANKLNARALDLEQRAKLKELMAVETQLHDLVSDIPMRPFNAEQGVNIFAQLGKLGQSILAQSDQLIGREAEALSIASNRAREILLWQLLAPIPLALLFAVVFTFLITRPFRQIYIGIRHIGDGKLNIPVVVSGPKDLVDLGKRLDWLRQRLFDLQEQKTKFFQHVSHELKTPLAGLREGCQILVDEVVGKLTPEQREITTILQHKTNQLQKLIYDLLNLSAAGAAEVHKGFLKLEHFDLKHTVRSVAQEQKLALKSKDLRFSLIGPDSLTIRADAEKIRIVIDNLLSNAIKFSPPGGATIMDLRRHLDKVTIDISDQGPGISEQDRDRVFEAFYQGRTPQQNASEGTGLGLAIIKEYVLAHNGHVEILQNGMPGAHFRVTLPLAPKETA
ncbi:MAG: HAMP domain-containing histidine kinase [Pseudomonadota bacterium]|nr:HAMP domain-containing histidine kinase [Pseudomonadota bacterium]